MDIRKREQVVTMGPEVGPMGQIWACYRGNRWLSWDQRLVPWDKYGLLIEGTGYYLGTSNQRLVPWDKYGLRIEGTGDYLGTRGWSHGTNMGL
jgi:hypothetical protein